MQESHHIFMLDRCLALESGSPVLELELLAVSFIKFKHKECLSLFYHFQLQKNLDEQCIYHYYITLLLCRVS